MLSLLRKKHIFIIVDIYINCRNNLYILINIGGHLKNGEICIKK